MFDAEHVMVLNAVIGEKKKAAIEGRVMELGTIQFKGWGGVVAKKLKAILCCF